jgi:sugar phosphate isomerase/epimerase
MSETQHTQGPWRTAKQGWGYQILSGDRLTAECTYDDVTRDQCEANARLIAEAPETRAQRDELLEALEDLLAEAVDISKAVCEENNVCYVQTPAERKAMEAIKNARGK